jgi:dolichol-phosphate mannosyltransferase
VSEQLVERPFLSLVVAVFYEEDCIKEFMRRTSTVLSELGETWEIVFVDDGSTDQTTALIKEAAALEPRIKLLELSYNHGKAYAVTAGISFARGERVLMMDPDLQDPPEEIPHFVAELGKGYDLVFGVRREKRDSLANVLMSKTFWWTLNRMSGLELPVGLSTMRIFNRRFADQLMRYGEQKRFLEGLFMHAGMKRGLLLVEHRERFAGVTKFNFRRKMNLAFDAILDYSELPLKLATRVGLLLTAAAIGSAVVLVVLRLFVIEFQMGWPSLMTMMLFCVGVQLIFMGLIGSYVGRIYREVKRRPLFSVKESTNL